MKVFIFFILLLFCAFFFLYKTQTLEWPYKSITKVEADHTRERQEPARVLPLSTVRSKKNIDLLKKNITNEDNENNIEDLILEYSYTSSKWKEYLRDAFIHEMNLEEVTIVNYYDALENYKKPYDKLVELLANLDKNDPKIVNEIMDKMISLLKKFQLEREKILGEKNIEYINNNIIPEFNRIYGKQTVIKGF